MKLKLVIKSYVEGGVFDYFDDGSTAVFDVAVAEIAGGSRGGEELRILIDSGSPLARLWNRPGETLAADVEPGDLDAGQLFADAFRIEERP